MEFTLNLTTQSFCRHFLWCSADEGVSLAFAVNYSLTSLDRKFGYGASGAVEAPTDNRLTDPAQLRYLLKLSRGSFAASV